MDAQAAFKVGDEVMLSPTTTSQGCLTKGQMGEVIGHHQSSKSHVNVKGPGGQTHYYEFQHLTKTEPAKDWSPLAQLEDDSKAWMGLVAHTRPGESAGRGPVPTSWKPIPVKLVLDSTENGGTISEFQHEQRLTGVGGALSSAFKVKPASMMGGQMSLIERRFSSATELPGVKKMADSGDVFLMGSLRHPDAMGWYERCEGRPGVWKQHAAAGKGLVLWHDTQQVGIPSTRIPLVVVVKIGLLFDYLC